MTPTYTSEQIEQWNNAAKDLLIKLDEALNKRTVEGEIEACKLLVSDEAVGITDKNRRLFILTILVKAELVELQNGLETRVFSNRTTEELQELYENIVFGLRRLEFNMSDEYINEFGRLLIAEHVSGDLMMTIINETTYLYRKDVIYNNLNSLLSRIQI